jgi:TRAP-type uncharacterized transport system substrate-binding protein
MEAKITYTFDLPDDQAEFESNPSAVRLMHEAKAKLDDVYQIARRILKHSDDLDSYRKALEQIKEISFVYVE